MCDCSIKCFRAAFAAFNVVVLTVVDPSRAQAPFTEESIQRGVAYFIPYQPGPTSSFGKGVAFADLDGDGDADLIALGRDTGVIGLYENDGAGFFSDRSNSSGIPLVANPSGVTAADFDGDRDLDLYLSNWLLPNLLLRNEGGLLFTDVTAAAGVGDPGAGSGCAWGDYDGDGWLDLYLSNRTGSDLAGGSQSPEDNRLYHNLGGGVFAELSVGLAVHDPGAPTFQAVFFDMDWDADADLYLSTDKGYAEKGYQNRLFENIGGAFVEISEASGTDAHINSMGVAVGDFDLNGYQDLYCTNTIEGNPLYLNQGDATFVDSADLAGVQAFAFGWGALFFDYDNNGISDLYVCNIGAANQLYVHDGNWPCVNLAPTLGVADQALSYGAALADIDNDGDLDLAVANSGDRLRLYINHEGQTRNWARFTVVGQGQNYFAIGARVAVRVGTTWHNREISAGGSYKSQNELTAHIGVDSAETLDEVVVTWPGGAQRAFAGLATNRTYYVVPPEALGDINLDGVSSQGDIGPFVGAMMLPDANPIASAHADFNGNGIPDGGDIAPFVDALLP